MDFLSNAAERYIYHEKPGRLWLVLLLAVMIAGVYWLVYFTGGIKYVYSHSMYIPIILSALFFGVKGGILAGLAGGIVLGPFMPIVTSTGEQQELINWVYRTGFFVLIGGITGISLDLLRKRLDDINWLRYNNQHTKLPNAESLLSRLEELAKNPEIKRPIYLLSIGSSNISIVKNTFGLNVVHNIIQQLNQRLDECLLFNLGIFNHHAEQMAVVLGNRGGKSLEDQVRKIVHAVELPYEYENIPVHIDFHVGCVIVNEAEVDPYSLQRKADIALNHAMDEKIDYSIYREEKDKTSRKNVGLLGSLRHAIESNELILHYQPKVDIASRELLGVEALIRWKHPEDGMIPPGNFIPQAEQTNLINPLTDWVVETAVERMEEWEKQGFSPAVAINISTRNLHVPGFDDTVYGLLESHRIPARRLEFEVTESALMKNPRHAVELLTKLADHNIIISIDDFGTGYSSLEYLCKLPATIIKIDQYFIRNMSTDKAVVNIIESAINLAHSLGMTVVAEGVEDEVTIKMLGDMGCDIVQGYYISRPIPENELLAFARTSRANIKGPV